MPTVDSRLPLSVLGSSSTTTKTTAVPSVGKMGDRHLGFKGQRASSAFIPLGRLTAESEEEESDSDRVDSDTEEKGCEE